MPNIFDQFDQQPQQPGIVPLTRGDPLKPLAIVGKGLDNQQTQAAITRSQATLPSDVAKAQADAERARAEADKIRRDIAGNAPPSPDKSTDLRGDTVALDNLDRGVEQLGGLAEQYFYNQGPKTPLEYAPAGIRPANGVFDTTGDRLSAFIAKGLGLTGQQFNTPTEQERFIGAYVPHASDPDDVIRSKIAALHDLAGNARSRLDAQLGHPSRRDDQAAPTLPTYGGQAPSPGQPPAGQGPAPGPGAGAPPPGGDQPLPPGWVPDQAAPVQQGLAQGQYRDAPNPVLRGVNNRIRYLLAQNRPAGDIVAYMNEAMPGLGDQRAADVAKAVEYRARHPEVPPDRYTISVENMAVPLSAERQFRNSSAQSPAGAFGIAAGDAASLGTIDNMTENPALTRAAMSTIAADNPVSSFAGSMVGGAAAVGGLEAGLARAGIARGAGLFAPRALAADVGYGAGYGAGSNDDNRLAGAGMGALTSAAGGVAGRGATRAVGSAIAPTGGALRDIYAAGVRPTVGQRFGNTNLLGRGVNFVEQAAQSIPGVGTMVRGARQRARDQFETGAFNEALGEIGDALPANIQHGAPAHAYMQRSFNNAYDRARSGMAFVPDQQFQQDGQAFFNQLGDGTLSADQATRVTQLINNIVASRVVRAGGRLDGDQYKLAVSELGKRARTLAPSEPLIADALRDFEGIVDDAARRSSHPDAVAMLDAADAGYARAVRVEMAADRVGNETGRFSPRNLASADKRATRGVRSRAWLRGDSLMNDYAQQGLSLSDTLPDSGTAARGAVGATVAGGAGLGAATGLVSAPFLIKLGLLAAPYLPGGREAVGAAMAPRASPVMNRVGQTVRDNMRYGGYLGAPALLTAYPPGQ